MMANRMAMAVAFGALALAMAGCRTAEFDLGREVPREAIEWQDTWIEAGDRTDSDLPRVLMLGDSISRQYRAGVGKLLAGKARIANSAGSHCVGDPMLNAANAVVLGAYDFEVIVVNNGLHGMDVDLETYARELAAYVDFLRAKAPRAKILWARTTPVSVRGDLTRLASANETVKARNAAADAIMAARGIPSVDLYGAVVDRSAALHVADGVHYNDQGAETLAKAVADAVLGLLK